MDRIYTNLKYYKSMLLQLLVCHCSVLRVRPALYVQLWLLCCTV
jgi:hypothetical protein